MLAAQRRVCLIGKLSSRDLADFSELALAGPHLVEHALGGEEREMSEESQGERTGRSERGQAVRLHKECAHLEGAAGLQLRGFAWPLHDCSPWYSVTRRHWAGWRLLAMVTGRAPPQAIFCLSGNFLAA